MERSFVYHMGLCCSKAGDMSSHRKSAGPKETRLSNYVVDQPDVGPLVSSRIFEVITPREVSLYRISQASFTSQGSPLRPNSLRCSSTNQFNTEMVDKEGSFRGKKTVVGFSNNNNHPSHHSLSNHSLNSHQKRQNTSQLTISLKKQTNTFT